MDLLALAKALRQAALRPPVFADLWRALETSEGMDRAALFRLLTTRSFSPKAAEDVLRLFRESAALAALRHPTQGEDLARPFEKDELKDLTEWGDVLELEGNRIRIQYRDKPRRQDFELLRAYFDLKLKHSS